MAQQHSLSADERQRLALDADRFRQLHQPATNRSGALALPNAWDAASASVLVAAGFGAIATSSGAVARSLGFGDGEEAPVDEMFGAVARIVRGATGPGTTHALVTADIEAGYGLGAAELVQRLAAAGAVGCNLEDSDPHTGAMVDAQVQARRIADVVDAAKRAGTNLVVNARVDILVRQAGDAATRTRRSIERANLYLEAGADCVFPILLVDEDAIADYVKGVPGPVNIMARPQGPSLERLSQLGVARVSFGSSLQRLALQAVEDAAIKIAAGEAPW
jgi:2-methylisocitrate lyase-like PEP mutase family enzyme